jgi:tetratricopeptide (TPR) repeat protein
MRKPEDHLTSAEVFAITSRFEGAHQSEIQAAIREHVEDCSECKETLEIHETLTMLPGSMNEGKHCISEDEIYRLAAGSLSPDVASKLFLHIRDCLQCSQALKQAIHDLDLVNSPAIDPSALRSSTPEWQHQLASKLADERSSRTTLVGSPAKASNLLHKRSFWVLGSIAATVIIASALTILYRPNQNVERLLAASYNIQRLTDLRIAGAQPVPLYSPQRGATSEPLPSVQLLEAKIEVQKHLEKSPSDAYWHQVMGRIALVEHNGDAARSAFELASALNKSNQPLPGIELDLADAYYEIGETHNDPIQYAYATNLYGQFIDDSEDPNRKDLLSIAYYNRALSWEKQSVYSEALKDYKAALAEEKSAEWRHDIQVRIERLEAVQKNKGDARSNGEIPSPAEFLSEEREHPEIATENYEIYLDAATRNWIFQHDRSFEVDSALHTLGRMGLEHRDSWLHDLLTRHLDRNIEEANSNLAIAISANAKGDANLALDKAGSASKFYLRAKDLPGYLRARAEYAYTLQRLGKAQNCFQVATRLLKDPSVLRYSWLDAFLLLEQASCQGSRGDIVASVPPLEKALRITDVAHLGNEHLRALSFLAEQSSMVGQTRQAWHEASEGLNQCEVRPGTTMRKYQFLSGIYFAAKAEGMQWTAAGLADAAADASLPLDNRQIQAYALEELGVADTAIHHSSSASAAFKAATTQLSSLSGGAARSLYDADWTADRAALLEQDAQLPAALESMNKVEGLIDSTDNHQLRQEYFSEFGHLLLSARRPKEALREALRATADSERSFTQMRTAVEKLTWERDNSRSYRILTQSLVDLGSPELSLRAWEWFRSAPYRAPWQPDSMQLAKVSLPPMPELPAMRKDEVVLVFARLENGYVAWSVIGDTTPQVKFKSLGIDSGRLLLLVQTLAGLVKNPASPMTDISFLGASIFRELMSPFEDQIQRARVLRIDIDPSLQAIPLAVIRDSDHTWLSSNHDIVVLPPWWSRHDLADESSKSLESAVVVSGNPTIDEQDFGTRVPDQYEESRDVAAKFRNAKLLRYPNLSASQVLGLLPSANVFHFSGHAIDRQGVTGLLLTTPDSMLTGQSFSAVSLRNCWVAVLAGCTTTGWSAYRAEDPRNLVNAILVSGASNVIATQWEVDARASREFTLRFYDALLSGKSPAAAVRSAQAFLLSSSSNSHPYFWAAYTTYSR